MQELLIVAGAHMLGAMSPGPDFALVLKTAFVNGRRAAIFSSIGIALGVAIHVLYSILGIALVVSQSIVLFNTIKLLGAAYLIWIGIKALRSKPGEEEIEGSDSGLKEDLNDFEALKTGFITNVLNPKATLFFLSLFTQVISPATSNIIKFGYGLEMTLMTAAWFSFVAVMMTQKPVRLIFSKARHHIDRVFGVVLVTLGIKVALESR